MARTRAPARRTGSRGNRSVDAVVDRVVEQVGLDQRLAKDPRFARVFRQFVQAVARIPPDDDLPLEPEEGGGSLVVGRAASREQSFNRGMGPDGDLLERGRLQAYVDYGDMDQQFPEVYRALDTVAEGAASNERGEPPYRLVFKPGVEEATRRLIEDCDERLDLPNKMKEVCRSAKKMGDLFAELVVDEAGTIVDAMPRSASTMFRVEDDAGRLLGYVQKFPGESRSAEFAPGQIVHLRASHEWGARYGSSMLKAGRFVYRKYAMMDDAMVVNRLVRAVQRYLFEIDVSGMDEKQANAHIEKVIERTRREPIVTSDGKLDLSSRAMADLQDIFFGVKTQGLGGVKVLEGSLNVSRIEDIRFLHRRLLVVLPPPPSFLGIEDSVNARATLNEEAINYARYLRATQQRELAPFPAKIHRRQAALAGRALARGDLEVRFGPVSVIDERVRAETLRVKAEAAKLLGVDLGFPTEFLLRHVLDLAPDALDQVLAQLADEEEAGQMPAPEVAAPEVGAGAERLGRGVRGVLEAQRQTRGALHVLQRALEFIASERRRSEAGPVSPTPAEE